MRRRDVLMFGLAAGLHFAGPASGAGEPGPGTVPAKDVAKEAPKPTTAKGRWFSFVSPSGVR